MNQRELSNRTRAILVVVAMFILLIVVAYDWGRDIVPRFKALRSPADVATDE